MISNSHSLQDFIFRFGRILSLLSLGGALTIFLIKRRAVGGKRGSTEGKKFLIKDVLYLTIPKRQSAKFFKIHSAK